MDPIDPKNVDKRTWERYVKMGLLDEKAYEKFNKGLPDVAEKSSSVDTVMMDDADLDDEDEANEDGDEA